MTYEDYEQAHEEAAATLKANKYRVQELPCCSTCGHCVRGYPEDPLECSLASKGQYTSGCVDDLGICDKWVKKDVVAHV